MRNASAKRRLRVSSTNNHYTQNKDVLCNPQNPENPDSEPRDRGEYPLGIILENYPFFSFAITKASFPQCIE
jgi:hypothetical protein